MNEFENFEDLTEAEALDQIGDLLGELATEDPFYTPPGSYVAVLAKAEVKQAKTSGNNYLSAQFQIVPLPLPDAELYDEEFVGNSVWGNFQFSGGYSNVTYNMFNHFGVEDIAELTISRDLIGRLIVIVVGDNKYQGRLGSQVKSTAPYTNSEGELASAWGGDEF